MLVTCHGWFPLTDFEAIEPGDFRRVAADRAVDQVADPRGRDRVPDQDL